MMPGRAALAGELAKRFHPEEVMFGLKVECKRTTFVRDVGIIRKKEKVTAYEKIRSGNVYVASHVKIVAEGFDEYRAFLIYDDAGEWNYYPCSLFKPAENA